MNEVQLWLLVFLQSLQLILQVGYFIISMIIRLQLQRQALETDKLIMKHLKEEEE